MFAAASIMTVAVARLLPSLMSSGASALMVLTRNSISKVPSFPCRDELGPKVVETRRVSVSSRRLRINHVILVLPFSVTMSLSPVRQKVKGLFWNEMIQSFIPMHNLEVMVKSQDIIILHKHLWSDSLNISTLLFSYYRKVTLENCTYLIELGSQSDYFKLVLWHYDCDAGAERILVSVNDSRIDNCVPNSSQNDLL